MVIKKIKEKIKGWKREGDYRLKTSAKEKLKNQVINNEIHKILKNKDYQKLIYLKSNDTQDLSDVDYFYPYDLIYEHGRFFPVPLLTKKNREKIMELARDGQIKVISRQWHEWLKHHKNEMLKTEDYYPPDEDIF